MLERKRIAALFALVPLGLFFPGAAGAAPTEAQAASISCGGHVATIVVTAASPHTVHGTGHRDVIAIRDAGHVVRAYGGNDLICGSGGGDVIYGGVGRDHINARSGHDVVHAGGGNDRVYGGYGDDYLYGGHGADHMYGGHGADHMYGGHGADHMYGGTGNDWCDGGTGLDEVHAETHHSGETHDGGHD